MPPSSPTIPQAQATEIRRLAHDLSNALEVVVQASYLLTTIELNADGEQWVKLLDQGVKQATEINRNLREYIRSQS